MMYLLTRTHSRHEFATAAAINEMMHRPDPDGDLRPIGALAVVPRKVAIIEATKTEPRKYQPVPFITQYMFLVLTPEHWHQIQTVPLFDPEGRLLAPPKRVQAISPIEWRGARNGNGGCQGFFARAEEAYMRRVEQFEAGGEVARYKKGDRLRIIGADLLTGQMAVQFVEFIRIDQHGRADVSLPGVALFGRPVTTKINMDQIEGIAAE